ncbi:head-tail connector protein [Numidum massiliense]|uniref:head-tail connector protein n=1 Tax=Numidum massiliense TaxID=1522315 RepID=UPI0006D57D3E|nr:head-tail connector protein [Numidum massiliense]
MILELEEAKQWLRVDGDEEDGTIQMLIKAAESYLYNATGIEYDAESDLARLLCLVLVSDWYENRELGTGKVSEKVRFTVSSITAQLQYAQSKEGDTDESGSP